MGPGVWGLQIHHHGPSIRGSTEEPGIGGSKFNIMDQTSSGPLRDQAWGDPDSTSGLEISLPYSGRQVLHQYFRNSFPIENN